MMTPHPNDWPPSPPNWQRSDLAYRVTRLEVVVLGVDGTNGIRGTQRLLDGRIKQLEKSAEAASTQADLAMKFLRWLGIVGIVLIGVFGPEPIVSKALNVLKLLGTAGLAP
jgi:hypothetical protein